MFDVDGTLVQSYDFDEQCFIASIQEVTGIKIDSDWESYPYVTDRGILMTFIERQAFNYSIEKLENLVKPVFITKIREHLISNPANAVEGAIEFLEHLKLKSSITLSIATGGWADTAIEKLNSAGFDLEGVPLASSNDHYSRIEIMKLAKSRADCDSSVPLIYFGDADWDLRACEELNANLVIVGDRVSHIQKINDFTEVNKTLAMAGLSGSM
ncbi:MAG: HAD hydrolase-like protein [Oceanospirillaceae bacterium]